MNATRNAEASSFVLFFFSSFHSLIFLLHASLPLTPPTCCLHHATFATPPLPARLSFFLFFLFDFPLTCIPPPRPSDTSTLSCRLRQLVRPFPFFFFSFSDLTLTRTYLLPPLRHVASVTPPLSHPVSPRPHTSPPCYALPRLRHMSRRLALSSRVTPHVPPQCFALFVSIVCLSLPAKCVLLIRSFLVVLFS